MMFAALLLQAALPGEPTVLDVEANRYTCQLAEYRLARFLHQWQTQLTRRITNRRHMLRFRQISDQIARPHLDGIRGSMRDGDPGWVCDRIAQQGIDTLRRDAIRPIFGDEQVVP